MDKRILLAFGIALSLIGIFVYAVGWEDVLAAVSRTSPTIYALAFASMLLCLFCRTLVWHLILGIVDSRRPFWLITGVFLTSMFAKYVVPYGQITSGVGIAAIISRYYETEYEQGLAGVLSADFLNYIPYYSFGTLGAIYVLTVYSPADAFSTWIAPVLLLLVILATVLGLMKWRRQVLLSVVLRVTSTINRLHSRLVGRELGILNPENVKQRFRGFFTTLELVSRDRRSVLAALVLAHTGWFALAGTLYFTSLAMDHQIPVGVAFFVLAMSKLGFVVPTPGGIGGVEFTLASVLYILSPIGFATATAIALLWRISSYWFTILLGGLTAIAVTIKDPLPPEG